MNWLKFLTLIFIFLLLTLTFGLVWAYKSSIKMDTDKAILNIYPNQTSDEILATFKYKKIHCNTFLWRVFNTLKPLPKPLAKGRYVIKNNQNLFELYRKIKNGKQDPINLTLRSHLRTLPSLAKNLSNYIDIDSTTIAKQLYDSNFQKTYHFDTVNWFARIRPNTYQIYWTYSLDEVMKKLTNDNDKFWNDTRKQQCKNINLTQEQVVTLASIVEEETKIKTEKPIVAGVYINRLQKNIPLQADPTVKYALQNFGLKRILFKHLEVNSPYNTYKNTGLPPGPICLPPNDAIDAVLQYQKHDYIFFCAKEDLSGYSNFAVTLAEHEANRKKYTMALNALGIR